MKVTIITPGTMIFTGGRTDLDGWEFKVHDMVTASIDKRDPHVNRAALKAVLLHVANTHGITFDTLDDPAEGTRWQRAATQVIGQFRVPAKRKWWPW